MYIISQIIVWLGFVEFSIQIVKNTYSLLNFNWEILKKKKEFTPLLHCQKILFDLLCNQQDCKLVDD